MVRGQGTWKSIGSPAIRTASVSAWGQGASSCVRVVHLALFLISGHAKDTLPSETVAKALSSFSTPTIQSFFSSKQSSNLVADTKVRVFLTAPRHLLRIEFLSKNTMHLWELDKHSSSYQLFLKIRENQLKLCNGRSLGNWNDTEEAARLDLISPEQ